MDLQVTAQALAISAELEASFAPSLAFWGKSFCQAHFDAPGVTDQLQSELLEYALATSSNVTRAFAMPGELTC